MSLRKIPDSDFVARRERVREIARSQLLDAIFVYYDELRSSSGWYLSGWCPQFESGAVVIPAHGEAAIFGGPESEPFALLDSHIKKTFNVSVFMVPDEEYPSATIHSIGDALREVCGGLPERLGVVGRDVMPVQVMERLLSELPSVEMIDVSDEFEQLRVIKSTAELDVMRDAFEINQAAYFAMKEAMRPGVPEYAVAAAAEGKARSLGAGWFGFRTIVASGERAAGVVPTASDRMLEAGECVMIGFSAKLDGYATASGNTIPLGGVSSDVLSLRGHLVDAFKIARDQLRPGGVGHKIDAPVRTHLEEVGLADYLLVPFFHTQGLNEADPPFFGPRSNDVLAEGMVVAIDVSMFGHPQLPGARLETVYVITADGAEAFSPGVESDIVLNSK